MRVLAVGGGEGGVFLFMVVSAAVGVVIVFNEAAIEEQFLYSFYSWEFLKRICGAFWSKLSMDEVSIYRFCRLETQGNFISTYSFPRHRSTRRNTGGDCKSSIERHQRSFGSAEFATFHMLTCLSHVGQGSGFGGFARIL